MFRRLVWRVRKVWPRGRLLQVWTDPEQLGREVDNISTVRFHDKKSSSLRQSFGSVEYWYGSGSSNSYHEEEKKTEPDLYLDPTFPTLSDYFIFADSFLSRGYRYYKSLITVLSLGFRGQISPPANIKVVYLTQDSLF